MIAVVESLEEADELISVLEDNRYEHRPNGDMEDRIFLAKGPEEKRTHYLSLAEKQSDFYQRTTAFRDYLNSHPAEAEKYCELKEELAKKHSDERGKYTEKKDEFIEKATSKALREKESS